MSRSSATEPAVDGVLTAASSLDSVYVLPGRPTRGPGTGSIRTRSGDHRPGEPRGVETNPSQLLRSHSTDPHTPATVHGLHHNGLLRVHLTSIGGVIDEYELTVEHALHLAQRLRDAATAMREFAATRPHAS